MTVDNERLRLVKTRWVETGKITARDVNWLIASVETEKPRTLEDQLLGLEKLLRNL